MEQALNRLPRGSKAAAVCPREAGACILVTPAMRLLKQRRPDIQWAAVVDAFGSGLFEGNPDVSVILRPHLPPLWSWRPRLCVDFQGSIRSLILTELSGAEVTAALTDARGAWAYSTLAPECGGHLAECYAALAFHLGVPAQDVPPAVLSGARNPKQPPEAVLYPFGAVRERAWPPESFIDVAKALQNRGFAVTVAGGRNERLSAFSAYRPYTAASVAEWKRLLAGAALYIGNHTWVTQMAAALQVPQVVLCPAGGCGRQAPWKAPAEVLAADGAMASIDPAQVMAAIDRLRALP